MLTKLRQLNPTKELYAAALADMMRDGVEDTNKYLFIGYVIMDSGWSTFNWKQFLKEKRTEYEEPYWINYEEPNRHYELTLAESSISLLRANGFSQGVIAIFKPKP